jgi:hypothetical protein
MKTWKTWGQKIKEIRRQEVRKELKAASDPLVCPRCGEKAFFHWCPNFKDDWSK